MVNPAPSPAPVPSPWNLPTGVVVALGLIGGVLEYLNQATFSLTPPWNQVVTFGLYAIPLFGASLLVGTQFRSALHLSPALTTAVTTFAAMLAAAITTFTLGAEVKGILEGVLAFLAFVGFGAAPVAVARFAAAHRA